MSVETSGAAAAVLRLDPRRWTLWSLPRPLVGYLLLISCTAVTFAVVGAEVTPLRWTDVATWLALVGCGAISVEATRRTGEQAGASRDLLAAWTLPIALLLPPVYALLAPVVLTALTQWRVGRSPTYRRVFSAAAIGIVEFGRSTLFHALVGPLGTAVHRGATGAALVILAGVGCGVVFVEVNALLVGTAVRFSSPETSWRELLAQRENLVLDLGELCIGVLIAVAFTITPLTLLVALPPMLLLGRALIHTQLQSAARTDIKTGLLNATAWQDEADREISRALRASSPLTVAIIDLDHFKAINDTYGHMVGDQLLVAIVDGLRAGLRRGDVLGRFGGEEFVLLLPHTGRAAATQIATRLRRHAAAVTVADEHGTPARVTVSIGAAVLGEHGRTLTDLLTAADHALYGAKHSGRDNVVFAARSASDRGVPES